MIDNGGDGTKEVIVKKVEGVPLNIREMFGDILDQDPVSVASRLEGDIFDFYTNNKELFDEVNAIVTVDRTGSHIYHPFIENVEETGRYSIHKLNLSSDRKAALDRVAIRKSTFGSKAHVMILLDSINKGGEVTELVTNLLKDVLIIKHIVVYLSKKETLGKLKSKKDFKKVSIHTIHEAESIEEYNSKYREMLVYKQSSNIPTDPEHVYLHYSILPKIECDELVELVYNSIESLKQTDEIDITSDEDFLALDSEFIRQFTIEIFGNIKDSLVCIDDFFSKNDMSCNGVSFGRAQIRIKIDNSLPRRTRLTNMFFISPELTNHLCSKDKEFCQLQKIEYKKSAEREMRSSRCPNCIERGISKETLLAIDNVIKEKLGNDGFEVFTKPMASYL